MSMRPRHVHLASLYRHLSLNGVGLYSYGLYGYGLSLDGVGLVLLEWQAHQLLHFLEQQLLGLRDSCLVFQCLP